MADKYQEILRTYWGYPDFRGIQRDIIESIARGEDTLGLMPTGGGKSITFQVPALAQKGVCIVVTPLIALMKDQVQHLKARNILAEAIYTGLSRQEILRILENCIFGEIKFLYVSPERLSSELFQTKLRHIPVSFITVDEAHCISQWGYDFRPSYLEIAKIRDMKPGVPVLALTATATPDVVEDIQNQLHFKKQNVFKMSFARKNLAYVVRTTNDKLTEMVHILQCTQGSAIIYARSRKRTKEMAELLNKQGISATFYHAGLDSDVKDIRQKNWQNDEIRVMVATNAFGMGIDKSNVSYVIHYNMPKNIESYYQEAGRAGRDGNEAKCILLYSGQDVATNKFLINNSHDNPDLDDDTLEMIRKRDLMRLKKMTDYCNTNGCLREFILGYFGEKQDKPCQNCSGCLGDFGETEEVDVSVDCQKVLSCIYRLHQRNLSFGAGVIAQILKGSDSEKVKRFDLSTLSTYGIMKDSTQVYIRRLIAFLEADDYITQTSHGDFSVLTLTRRSAEILMDKKTITIRLPKKKPKSETVTKIGRDEVTTFDKELFGRLRAVRSKLATQASLPAYIILTDASLRDMCIKLPKTQTELLNISGVGKSKQERYGRYFVAEIQKYLKENPDAASGYKYIPEGYLQKQNAVGGQSTKEYIIAHAGELSGKEQDMTLSEVCDSIFYQLGTDGDIRSIKLAIKEWLIGENYLAKDGANGRGFLETTILSPEAGIIEREKISQLGNSYKTILFPKQAQEFIFENIEEILSKDAQNS